jgi:type I restriction enzyme S subunit
MMVAATHPLFENPLPKNWKLVTVDDIKSPEKSSCVAGPFGSNISSKYFVDAGVPVIRGSNLRDDLTRFVSHGFAFVSSEQAQRYKAQHVRCGDIVFTCWGTLGQVGLIPSDGPFPDYIISNKQLKLRPNLEISDPLYLFYYFAGPKMIEHIRNKAIGAAVPGINLGILKGLPVVLPPLSVQRRIASILGTYDDLIEVNRRRIVLLEEMARQLFEEWFVRFHFPGHECHAMVETRSGPIPEGWHLRPLEEMLMLQRGFDLPTSARTPGPYSVIAASGVHGSHTEAKVRGPGIVTGRSGTLGKVMFVHEDHWPLNTTLFVKEFRRASPAYGLQLLRHLKIGARGGGAAVPTLNRNHLHGLIVPCPPPELVAAYERNAMEQLKAVRVFERQQDALAASRDLLLPSLLSGELSVSAPERELQAVA